MFLDCKKVKDGTSSDVQKTRCCGINNIDCLPALCKKQDEWKTGMYIFYLYIYYCFINIHFYNAITIQYHFIIFKKLVMFKSTMPIHRIKKQQNTVQLKQDIVDMLVGPKQTNGMVKDLLAKVLTKVMNCWKKIEDIVVMTVIVGVRFRLNASEVKHTFLKSWLDQNILIYCLLI